MSCCCHSQLQDNTNICTHKAPSGARHAFILGTSKSRNIENLKHLMAMRLLNLQPIRVCECATLVHSFMFSTIDILYLTVFLHFFLTFVFRKILLRFYVHLNFSLITSLFDFICFINVSLFII